MKQHTVICSYPEGCSCGASEWNSIKAENKRLRQKMAVVLRSANNSIYFNDNSDYQSALFSICKEIGMDKDDIGAEYITTEGVTKMETEVIDKLFLELAQITTAKTERELELESALQEAIRLIEQGKRQFTPHTTNSDVDMFLSRYNFDRR